MLVNQVVEWRYSRYGKFCSDVEKASDRTYIEIYVSYLVLRTLGMRRYTPRAYRR